MQVSYENTDLNVEPYVAMSRDGHWVVTWEDIAPHADDLDARVFDAQGNTILDFQNNTTIDNKTEFGAVRYSQNTDFTPTASWDQNDDFAISWTEWRDTDSIPEQPSNHSDGVYLTEYDITGKVLRTDTRVNSAIDSVFFSNQIGLDPTTKTIWSLDQYGEQVAMDANGDITDTYQGFGPDVSQVANSGRAPRPWIKSSTSRRTRTC